MTFGIAATIGGVFEVATGRRSIGILIVVIVLAFLLWVVGTGVYKALG